MKNKGGSCSWEWFKDTFHGGFAIGCDIRDYIWEYRKKNVMADFKFCPNCGRRIEFVNESAK